MQHYRQGNKMAVQQAAVCSLQLYGSGKIAISLQTMRVARIYVGGTAHVAQY